MTALAAVAVVLGTPALAGPEWDGRCEGEIHEVCPPGGPEDCRLQPTLERAGFGDTVRLPPDETFEDSIVLQRGAGLEGRRRVCISSDAGEDRPLIAGTFEILDSEVAFFNVRLVGAPALDIKDSRVILDGVQLAGESGAAADRGGVVDIKDSVVDMLRVEIRSGEATSDGGLVHSENTTLRVQTGLFASGVAATQGGGLLVQGGEVLLREAVFEDNDAIEGGAIYLEDTVARLESVTVIGGASSSLSSSAISIDNSRVDALDLYVCTLGGYQTLVVAEDVWGTWRNSFFVGLGSIGLNVTAVDPVEGGTGLDLHNNHFVDLTAIGIIQGDGVFYHNALIDLSERPELDFPGIDALWNYTEFEGFADFGPVLEGQDPPEIIGSAGLGPRPQDSCTPRAFLVHAYHGLLRDAGTDTALDPDGSRVDLGAFGGPEALLWEDEDGDGTPALFDCPDDDPTKHLGAIDNPGDGVDQNCDGTVPGFDNSGVRYGLSCSAGALREQALPGLALLVVALLRRRRRSGGRA